MENRDATIEVQKDTKLNEQQKWYIYCHTSPSDKKYVGITSQSKPEYRWGKDGCKYLGTNPDGSYKQVRMARAVNKYPWDLWTHEILAVVYTKEDAKELEQYFIKYYRTKNPEYGYNCTDGGDGVSDKDRTGAHNSNYGNHKLAGENNPMWGKHHSEETKKKISDALSNPSAETRKKISDAAKARQTDEYKQKQSAARKGIVPSEETRKKQSQAQKDRWTDEARKAWSKKFSGPNHPCYGKRKSQAQIDKQSQYMKGKFAGYKNPNCNPVYCIQLHEIFWGARAARVKYNINDKGIGRCCSGKAAFAGEHPVTGEKLEWKYVNSQVLKDGTAVQGAIELGYITQEQVDNYFNILKGDDK